MDLGAMMSKIDLHGYQTAMEFLDDINLICLNALEYNPDKTQTGKSNNNYLIIMELNILILDKR
jgi:hypothetical protein